MLKTDGVLHFTIPVKDLARSEKFYTEVVGLTAINRNDHMVFMRAGAGDYLVLTYSEKPIDPNAGDKHEVHSAFRMNAQAYDDALKFLAAKGVRVFKEEDRKGGTFQGRSAYFHDPDRNVIEIIDLKRPPVDQA